MQAMTFSTRSGTWRRITVRLLSFGLLAVSCFAAQGHDYVASTVGDATHWTALNWTPEEVELFGGTPEYHGADKHTILVRYLYYVSNYDVDRLTPLWVAHVDERDAELKDRGRTKGEFSRKDDKFTPDANVVTYSKSLNLPFATDASYSSANPSELPVAEKGYTKITRGHMASNREMKSLGDETQGVQSQKESFSLANVSPQMQHHNAPIWAKLEYNCIEWAGKLGPVAVLTGPIFAPDPALPPPGNQIMHTAGKDHARIPIPTHFFKVIIGRVNGKTSAIGFLIPHRSDLALGDLNKFVVPIRRIEQITEINFMPKLGANDAIETRIDGQWLKMIR